MLVLRQSAIRLRKHRDFYRLHVIGSLSFIPNQLLKGCVSHVEEGMYFYRCRSYGDYRQCFRRKCHTG